MSKTIDRRRAPCEPLLELRCRERADFGHLLGAKISPDGLLFWCRHCHEAHLLTWQELEECRRSVALGMSGR